MPALVVIIVASALAAISIGIGCYNLWKTGFFWTGERDLDMETWQARFLLGAFCWLVVGLVFVGLGL